MKNKTTNSLFAVIVLSVGLLFATTANASLVSALGGQVVNDTDLNITWLANANLAATNKFGVSGIAADGRMTWNTANAWIAAMNASNNGVGYLDHNDWRLPTFTPDGTCGYQGYGCTDGELGHFYFNELGNKAYMSNAGVYQPDYGLVDDPYNPNDESLFSNLKRYYYWSSTDYSLNSTVAMGLHFDSGVIGGDYKNVGMDFVLAVRTGQVAAAPEPATYTMLLAGLGLLGFTIHRRKLNQV
jgi:hypothetical protein